MKLFEVIRFIGGLIVPLAGIIAGASYLAPALGGDVVSGISILGLSFLLAMYFVGLRENG
ncbi:MAG: hypothetical protein Q8O98_02535 [bacterium]|nr:hypothetical protein [bacterium]